MKKIDIKVIYEMSRTFPWFWFDYAHHRLFRSTSGKARPTKFSIIALSAFIILSTDIMAQDLAVIPYAVDTIERDFTAQEGEDYSKIIAVGSAIAKDMQVFSFRETQKDLARMGLDPQGKITKEDMALFCKSRYLSYAVLGRISKTTDGFASQSVLYSAARDAVVAKANVKARSLPELASREILELFSMFDDAKEKSSRKRIDCALVLDTSYSMSRDWNELSRGLVSLVSNIIDGWPGSKVHFVPFAENFTLKGTLPEIETVPAMKNTISTVKLKGGSTAKAVASALDFAIENSAWGTDSVRILYVVSNSPVNGSFDAQASKAKRKHITVNTLVLGNVGSRDTEIYRRLSVMTGGKPYAASYRQKLFDKKGDDYFLYMQSGRLFMGDAVNPSWKDGILNRIESGSGYVEPPSFADEVTVKGDSPISPYTMADYFRKSGSRGVLNSDPLESNLSLCISSIADKSIPKGDPSARPIARVLLTQGKSSVWISIRKPKDLEYFYKQKELGFVFPLGVRIMLQDSEPSGMTFNPDYLYTGFDWEGLPQSIRVNLDDIQKQPEKFTRNGLFSPPVFFVNVKVDQIDDRNTSGDIRR